MAIDHTRIGHRVRTIRKRRGLTQERLSELINCTPTYISHIESGNKSMSLETLILIANALNVTADELLVDSLQNTLKVSNHAFTSLLNDCTEYERRVLLDTVASVKTALRDNRQYFPRMRL